MNIIQHKPYRNELKFTHFRYERTFIVKRKENREPQLEISKTLEVSVGGFIGIKRTSSICKITLDKDQFYPGEDIIIDIDCDNTKCKKPI